MRIVLIGQAAFGEKVLQTLVDGAEEVVGVYTPHDIQGRINPLRQLALQLRIPTFYPEGIQDPRAYEEYASLKPDLSVMAYVTSIVPEAILDYPIIGTIQYHPSLLPKHRGASAVNWAIIKGETKTGITIFWPAKGIDTGPVLLQKEVEISPDDTVGSRYFNKLFHLGIEAVVESIELIRQGIAPRIIQDESQASYEGLCTENNAVINWLQPVIEIYNLIRGTNPQPGAITNFGGRGFRVFDSELHPSIVGGFPGEIIDITREQLVVAATDGTIIIKQVQTKGAPKVSSVDFAKQAGLKVGDRLG